MANTRDCYKVFISYERQDSGGWAASIYNSLKSSYGDGVVFKDEEETSGGVVWSERLVRLVQQCDVVLVIIGQDWRETRVRDKLRKPTEPLYREIITAITAKKWIIPIVLQGAQVPSKNDGIADEIEQAINSRHHVPFPTNSALWPQAFERLCAAIEAHINLPRIWPSTSYQEAVTDQMLCRLDRHSEFGSAKQGFVKGHQLFMARGFKRAGFPYFALRCALEVITACSQRDPQVTEQIIPRYESLPWLQFSEIGDAYTRKILLLEEIARGVFKEKKVKPEHENEFWLKERIKMNGHPTVIFSTMSRQASADHARVREWFEIWQELLSFDQRRSLVVVLFVELGWWPWSAWRRSSPDVPWFDIQPRLGKVKRSHVDDWIESEVRRLGGEQLRRRLQTVASRLYRFRRGRHFEDISRNVQAH